MAHPKKMKLKKPYKMPQMLAVSPRGDILAMATGTPEIALWELLKLKQLDPIQTNIMGTGHNITARGSLMKTEKIPELANVNAVSFSPDGKQLGVGLTTNKGLLIDVETGEVNKILEGHAKQVRQVSFSPDGRKLATASWDKTVKIWDAGTGKEILTLAGHVKAVYRVRFSPTGDKVASCSEDATINVWDINSGTMIQTCLFLEGRAPGSLLREIKDLAWDAAGEHIIGACTDNSLKIWSINSPNPETVLRGHSDQVVCLQVSPDGKTIASGAFDKCVMLWDYEKKVKRDILSAYSLPVQSLSWCPNGTDLVSLQTDSELVLWTDIK